MAVVEVCSKNCRKCKFCKLDSFKISSRQYRLLVCEMRNEFIDRSWKLCDKYEAA